MNQCRRRRLAVIGGGISGLAAANRIWELDPSVDLVLLEAGPRLGGVLRTERRDGFMIEYGADNFITTIPTAIEFCQKIGFDQEIMPTNADHRRAFVLSKGKLRPIPSGFALMAPSRMWPVLSTPVLSVAGKLRLASELLVPRRRSRDDESLASFVTRRLGRETYERLVQPLVAGIYTADPERLSLRATMPRFQEMERKHGSLIRAMWKQKGESKRKHKKSSGARYSQFVAPQKGMTSLVDAVSCRFPDEAVYTNAPVKKIVPLEHGWKIEVDGSANRQLVVEGIILAIPSHPCARLLRDIDKDLSHDLSKIEYGSCALVTFGFDRKQIAHRLDGFGFVVPLVERRKILSASFSSVKYPGRAPKNHELIRTFVGGACQRQLLELSDEQLIDIAFQELADILGIDGQPQIAHINRQMNAMPQYHVGHVFLAERIAARTESLSGVAIAGNFLHGIGIPQCIHTAEQAAERLVAEMASQPSCVSMT